MEKKPILKVYPSRYWGNDVVIIGNRKGLENIKTAIELALEGNTSTIEVTEVDDIPYNVCATMFDGDMLEEAMWSKLPMHYDDGDNFTEEEKDFLSKALWGDFDEYK